MRSLPLYESREQPIELSDRLSPDPRCTRCPRYEGTRTVCQQSDVMVGRPLAPGGVMVVGSAPTKGEDDAARPFSSQTNMAFRRLLEGMTPLPVAYMNALRCWKPPKKKATEKEVTACRPYTADAWARAEPSRILCLGKEAFMSVLGTDTPPEYCRRGYSHLSDGTPVFLLPSPTPLMFGNHFALNRYRGDVEWALTADPDPAPQVEIKFVESDEDDADAAIHLRSGRYFTFDTETAGIIGSDYFEVLCLAVVPEDQSVVYLWDADALAAASVHLRAAMIDETCRKTGHNLKFDIKAVAHHFGLINKRSGGLKVRGVFADTLLWRKLLDSDARGDLEYSAELVGMGGHKAENAAALEKAVTRINEARSDPRQRPLSLFRSKPLEFAVRYPNAEPKAFAFGLVPKKILHRYCALDTMATARLCTLLEPMVKAEPAFVRTTDTFLRPSTEAIAQIESWGMSADADVVRSNSVLLHNERENLLSQLRSIGCDVQNLDSDQQVADYLYGKLKLPVPGLTDSGQPSVKGKLLEKIKDKHPAVPLIIDYAKAGTLIGTFADGMLPHIINGRIRTHIAQDGTRSGRFSSRNPNCFDGETEILTERGWVRFDELPRGLRVAQWDDGAITFVEPIGYVEHEAETIRISSRNIDLVVTPDHRCLYRDRKTGAYRVRSARDYPRDAHQLQAGFADGPGLGLTRSMVTLMCALQADGHICKDGAASFTFKKRRKYDRLIGALHESRMGFTHSEKASGTLKVRVPRVETSEIAAYLTDKRFDWRLLEMSRTEMDWFVEEVMFWDGCWTRKSHYASKDKVNSDVVQAIHALSGVRARLRRYTCNGDGFSIAGSTSWQVDVRRVDYSLTTNSRVMPAGKRRVYCVRVPSSYVVVRRAGNVMITGNCQNIPGRGKWAKVIKNSFNAPPGHALIQLDYSQLELRIAALMTGDPKMIQIYKDGVDFHKRTAELIAEPMWGIDPSQVNASHRRNAKDFNFGVWYGQGDGTIAENLSIPRTEAAKLRHEVMGQFEVAERWIEECKARTRKTGDTWTYWEGQPARRRLLHNIASPDDYLASKASNGSFNSVIQGTAAQYMERTLQAAVDWILSDGIPARVTNTVHDSIILEAPFEWVVEVVEVVKSIMEGWWSGEVPLVADADVGMTWGAMLDFDKLLACAGAVNNGSPLDELCHVVGFVDEDGHPDRDEGRKHVDMAKQLGMVA